MAVQIIRCPRTILLATALLLCCTCVVGSDPLVPSYPEAFNQIQRYTNLAASRMSDRLAGSPKELLDLISTTDIGSHILNFASDAKTGGEVGVKGFTGMESKMRPDQGRRGREAMDTGAAMATDLRQCWLDFFSFFDAVSNSELWALQMVDAFGKPSPAILDLNLLWLGAYDECRDVTVPQNTSGDQPFTGKYCNADVPVALESSTLPQITIKEGLCVPSSCSALDVQFVINILLIQLNNSEVNKLRIENVTCAEPATKLDTMAIAALSVCGMFVVLMLVGTLLDVVLVQLPKLRSEDTLAILMTGVDSKGEREPLLDVQKQPLSFELGTCSRLLTSFSLYSNMQKLLDTRQSEGTLTCVHGIRFLSMTWVVLGHCFWVATIVGSWNVGRWLEMSMKRVMFQLVGNALVAVDTFFVLSGLLVSYLSLREMRRRKGGLNWFLFYLHRFWRLTPVYMLLIFIYLATMKYWGEGPAWPETLPDRDNCRRSWWTNLLYVNNLVKTDEMCFGHAWYLADDMQFYILSPLIFVPFYYSAAYGCLSALLFLIASTATPTVLTVLHHYPPGVLVKLEEQPADSVSWMQDFYMMPYNRMAPYIVGLVAGYVLYRCNGTLRMPKVVALLGWVVAGAMGLAALFGLYDATANDPMPLWQAAFYNAAGRTAWGLFVAWVVLACATGNGGFVNSLLSWGGVVPLSRLTYCVYLVHLPLIYTVFLMRRTAFFVTDLDVVLVFFGMLLAIYLVALVTSMLFEAPLLGMERVMLHRDGRASKMHEQKTF